MVDRVRRATTLTGLAIAAIALFAWVPTVQGDTWMYAATGRWVADHHAVPWHDPFSWTLGGQPWQSNAWAWGVVLWVAQLVGGFAGLALVKAVMVGAIGAAIAWTARSLGGGPAAAGTAAVLALVGILPWITDRPQIASYLMLPVALGLGHRAVQGARLHPAWLAATAGCFVVWVNLHSVALFGVAVVGAFAVGAGIDSFRETRSARGMLVGLALVVSCALALLVNPYGAELLVHSLDVASKSSRTISEWYPAWMAGATGLYTFALAVAAGVVIVVRRGWERLALALPLVVCALAAVNSIRNTPLLVIVAACTVPALLDVPLPASWRARQPLAAFAAVALFAVSLLVTVSRLPSMGSPDPVNPVAAANSLASGCHLRNDYRLGGWIIFDREDVPVSADGRNDLMDPDGYAQNPYFESSDAAATAAQAFSEEGTDCVVALPGSPLVPALVDAGWTVTGQDAGGVALRAPATDP